MILELWYYKATLPNNGGTKHRPVLIIGDDGDNGLSIVDIHYCLVSATAVKGEYDVEIDDDTAKNIGLSRASVIKTTKIFTGSKGMLGSKISTLPDDIKNEFVQNFTRYQANLNSKLK